LTAAPVILTRRPLQVILLSALLCLANVAKPLVVDDTAYFTYAAQIAEHPLDPYGFTIFWYQRPQPAFEVLAPPVFCYWWALGIRLFGNSPVLWKLWLWPWCVLFAAAVVELCRRCARPVAGAMAWFIVGSPTVLPALNLMLDVPAEALSLAAVALFLRARAHGQWPAAFLVGILTAAAMQTKYTALIIPAVLLAAAWATPRRRRRRAFQQALIAVVVAAALFCTCEWFVARKYGASHFLLHAARLSEPWTRKLLLYWPLIGILGGVGAPLIVLGLAAFRVPRFALRLVIGLIAASWIAFGALPARITLGWIGALALAAMLVAALRSRDRRGRFLAVWWLLELSGYFLLSPWPAVRRLIGICVVGALVLAHRLGPTPDIEARRRVLFAVALSVGSGVLFQVIDTSDAAAERSAVKEVARLIQSHDANAQVWYTGHLGMKFYADRAGWRPVVPGESRLPAGSWLVIPDRSYGRQEIELPEAAREIVTWQVSTPWPLHTIPANYGGNKAIEWSPERGTRLRVYRLEKPCTPQAPAHFGDDSDRRRH
jgi:hypothetical protein